MSDVLGPNSFNGLGLFAGALCASLVGALLMLALGGAWLARRTVPRARRFRSVLWLTLGNNLAVFLLFCAMEYGGLFGPRVPAWIDWLGIAWVVAFIAALTMMVLRPAPPSAQDSRR